MLVTEEQAREIECPIYTATGTLIAALAASRGERLKSAAEIGDLKYCRGSRCMWWLQAEPAIHDVDTGEARHAAIGFCGLAGKP